MGASAPSASSESRTGAQTADKLPDGLVSRYRRDHQIPVNHFLHVGVGWPLAALSVILLPFRPFWSIGLLLAAYVIMFSGHFLFEHNRPTVLKHPTTPLVIAYDVVRRIVSGVVHVAISARGR